MAEPTPLFVGLDVHKDSIAVPIVRMKGVFRGHNLELH